MNKTIWLIIAAGLSFFMAAVQVVVSIFPAAAAYFEAPTPLQQNHLLLLLVGGGAALIVVIIGLYALSGAKKIRRLPLLRLVLVGISTLFLLRGLFIILTVFTLLGILDGEILIQGVISHLVFLVAGVLFTVGTVINWIELQMSR
jgi:hypothetical protein